MCAIDLLTPRERECVHMLGVHGQIRQAAFALFIEPSTMKNHLTSAYRKLGIRGGAGKGSRATYLLAQDEAMDATAVTR